MNPTLSQPWIPLERIEALVQLEPFVVLVGLALGAWGVYKIFLRNVNEERHLNLGRLFRNLWGHLAVFVTSFAGYWALFSSPLLASAPGARVAAYLGLFTILMGAVVFVKSSKIILFEWLFFSHMRVGVPLLLVNIFTLVLSIVVMGVLAGQVFSVKIAPFLATSAVLSLVLGLAVQDTLGNLFAGIALQVDKPYNLGDWIEVHSSDEKWEGQVYEVSWRATILTGWQEQLITIPNRVISSAEVINWSIRKRPIFRAQVFRIATQVNSTEVRAALLDGVRLVSEVCHDPAPRVLIVETHESWTPYKLIFAINDYGRQFIIFDQVIQAVHDQLRARNIALATPQLEVRQKVAG